MLGCPKKQRGCWKNVIVNVERNNDTEKKARENEELEGQNE